jgi:hypothetical protein
MKPIKMFWVGGTVILVKEVNTSVHHSDYIITRDNSFPSLDLFE